MRWGYPWITGLWAMVILTVTLIYLIHPLPGMTIQWSVIPFQLAIVGGIDVVLALLTRSVDQDREKARVAREERLSRVVILEFDKAEDATRLVNDWKRNNSQGWDFSSPRVNRITQGVWAHQHYLR